jgi:cytidine deaminase
MDRKYGGKEMTDNELIAAATEVKKNAYSPYSKFRVGAALLTGSGKLYTGVNVENATYGATCCAERTAVHKAVSEGERVLKAIAISSDSEDIIFPCGICRQVLAEFADTDMRVICSKNNGEFNAYTLGELLPNAFKKTEVNLNEV